MGNNRYIVGKEFAVIYSPWPSVGWYTSHRILDLLFSPYICKIIEQFGVDGTIDPLYNHDCEYGLDLIEEFIDKSYKFQGHPNSRFIEVGPLRIKWVPIGQKFAVFVSSDGREHVIVDNSVEWIV